MPTHLTPSQIAARVCYLETIGRFTGELHEIEIWFASDGSTVYMLSGGRDRSDWVKNLVANPAVRIRINNAWVTGIASVAEGTDRDLPARQLIAAKYYGWTSGPLPNDWARESLSIRICLTERHAYPPDTCCRRGPRAV